MEVRKICSSVGRYNLFSSDDVYRFKAGLFKNDRLVLVDGDEAIIEFTGDPEDKDLFDEYFDEGSIGELFRLCSEYTKRIISTSDDKKRERLFAKLYIKNYEEISENFIAEKKKKIMKEIGRLETEFNSASFEDDIDFMRSLIHDDIQKIEEGIERAKKELKGYKKRSEHYRICLERISRLENEKTEIENLL